MNTLSLLLYLADVLPTLSRFFFVISTASVIIGALVLFVSLQLMEDGRTQFFSMGKKLLIIALITFPLGTLFPSKDTIYLIAASELGEEALDTDRARKIGAIIDTKLEDLLDDAKAVIPGQNGGSN